MPQSNQVAPVVLSKSNWAVLALTLHIELFTQAHYRESIAADENLSPLFKDVFMFHWREESQHAILDELELRRHDATLSSAERDRAIDDFVALIGAIDEILQAQAAEDVRYFTETCGRLMDADERRKLATGVLAAYRGQYIFSGANHPRFLKVMDDLITVEQTEKIDMVLASLR